ncbi:MAG: diacylglycerol kinase family protein [Caldilineales bacterium]
MRALLVSNPTAGWSRVQRQLPEALMTLRAAGWRVEWERTQAAGSMETLAEQAAAAGYEAFIACGGDGSINQAINGLLRGRQQGSSPPALGILPAGTANVLARTLGLPAPLPGPVLEPTLPAAARLLAGAVVHPVDVGEAQSAAGRRIFLCWAGIGLDAAVAADVMAQPALKRRLGPLSFAANLLIRLPDLWHAPRYTLDVDGARWQGRGIVAVVSNIPRYAVVLDMAPQAALDDGLLDVAFFHNVTLWNAGATLARLLLHRHPSDPNAHYAQARRIEIVTARPEPVHLDAEPFGQTPLTISVLPAALPLLLPRTTAGRRLLVGRGGSAFTTS